MAAAVLPLAVLLLVLPAVVAPAPGRTNGNKTIQTKPSRTKRNKGCKGLSLAST